MAVLASDLADTFSTSQERRKGFTPNLAQTFLMRSRLSVVIFHVYIFHIMF